MDYTKIMQLHLIVVFISAAFLTPVDLRGINLENDRQGWKTSGNGYFIYEAFTSFENAKQLNISGTFATTKNNTINNMLLAAEDSNGNNIFQYSVSNGEEQKLIRPGLGLVRNITGITSGYVFHFTLTLSVTLEFDGNYLYNLESYLEDESSPLISTSVGSIQNSTWDLHRINFFIGGYNSTSKNYFQGCLSEFIFDGVDIIQNYFDEYPNNINPITGPLVIGNFSNTPGTCEDLIAPTSVSPTKSLETETTSIPNSSIRLQPKNYLIQFHSLFIMLLYKSIVNYVK